MISIRESCSLACWVAKSIMNSEHIAIWRDAREPTKLPMPMPPKLPTNPISFPKARTQHLLSTPTITIYVNFSKKEKQ